MREGGREGERARESESERERARESRRCDSDLVVERSGQAVLFEAI